MDPLNIENTIIKHIDQEPETFLKKTIVLFGPSNTGKTVIVKHILNLLKDRVPICMAFVPTDNPEDEDSYSHIIDPLLVIRNLDGAIEKLKNLINRQTEGRETISRANNFNDIKRLYEKNKIDKIEILIKEINNAANNGIEKINSNYSLSQDEKNDKIRSIDKSRNEKIHKFYKDGIMKYRDKLIQDHNNKNSLLTEDEMFILKYMNYNNNVIIIFDDCMAEINKWGKDNEIKKIFFQGRHLDLTTMFVMHGDKGFPPDLRANAFINIFTSSTVAINYFQTKNNGISKDLHKKIESIITKIFKKNLDPNAPNNYKKLVFIPRDDNPIQYIVARNIMNMKFGCQSLKNLTDKIKKDDEKNNQGDGKKLFTI